MSDRRPSRLRSYVVSLAIVALIALTTTTPNAGAASSAANGNANQNGQGGVAKSKPGPRPAPAVVEKVNTTTNIIAVRQGKNSQVYDVDAVTRIIVNGKSGKLSDIKAGMRVSVTTGSDTSKAVKIDAGNGR